MGKDEEPPRLKRAVAWLSVATGVIGVLAFFGISNWHDLRGRLFHEQPAQSSATSLPAPSAVLPAEIQNDSGIEFYSENQTRRQWTSPLCNQSTIANGDCQALDECVGFLVADYAAVQPLNGATALEARVYAFPDDASAVHDESSLAVEAFPLNYRADDPKLVVDAGLSGRIVVVVRVSSLASSPTIQQLHVAALAAADQIGKALNGG